MIKNIVTSKGITFVKIIVILSIQFLLFLTNFSCNSDLDEENSTYKSSYPAYFFNRGTFVSFDYIFENEGLNKPTIVRQNPATKELVVLDKGNTCLYVFSTEGKFIRKMGRPGQGPGDLLEPCYFTIDTVGDIYVYELLNNRFSIFSKEGKFINSFRINKASEETSFTISNERNIVAFIYNSGYYITVFSRNGEIIKEIGEITKYNDKVRHLNEYYASSFIFVDTNGNYIVFLKYLPIVKIFNKSGKLIKEHFLEKELGINFYNKPEKLKSIILNYLYHHIVYRNNEFYILMHLMHFTDDPNSNYETFIMYVLDKDFNKIRKIYLPLKEPFNKKYYTLYVSFGFDILIDSEEIIIPVFKDSKIFRYFNKQLIR